MKNQENKTGHKRTLTGTVVSNKATKTLVVKVERRFKHAMYRKYVKTTKKFYAHDEEQKAQIGDAVVIVESKPISKLKRWALQEIKK